MPQRHAQADSWVERTPVVGSERPAVWVQSVLYQAELRSLERALEAVARSAELAVMEDGVCARVAVRWGDCSPHRCLEDADVERIRERHGWIIDFRYVWFGENLGSAEAHNRLAQECDGDLILVMNPDVVMSPRVLEFMIEPFRRTGVGMVEAKQMPIEHPKDYDPMTGDTAWAATACAMTPATFFRELGGFDSASFFLYCDDVDYSWRVRQHGLRVVFQPAATVMHDKRLKPDGGWEPTSAERYYSAEAALVLAHKWSRPDLVEQILESFARDGGDDHRRAAEAFRARAGSGGLPEPVDPDHLVGVFRDGYYAPHRFEVQA